MNFFEFSERTKKYVEEYYGDKCEVYVDTIGKNNGVEYKAIIIRKKDGNVSPTLYIDKYYEEYMSGIPFWDAMNSLINDYEVNSNMEFDVSFFKDYEKVSKRIIPKLINLKLNKKMLSEVPYNIWNDLAIVYLYLIEDYENKFTASVLIKNEHLNLWGIDKKRLHADAKNNAPKLMPTMLKPISELLLGVPETNLYVLSNEQKLFGATSLLYSDAFDELADHFKSGLYILPSSIHEVIIVPDNEIYSEEYLHCMIQSVNEAEVENQDILSDSLYHYDPVMGEITVAM